MQRKHQVEMAGLGNIDRIEADDLDFPQGGAKQRDMISRLEMSPSKRRAAARTKKLSASVNPKLYAAWNEVREDKEQSVVRALELSLIAYLKNSGQTFDL